MHGETKSGMQCAEFDALLADALDGALTGANRERFEAHKASCPSCGPLFTAARTGFEMLHALQEVEPPKTLVHNILAQTTGQVVTAPVVRPANETFLQKFRRWTQPVFGPVLQPRFAMSFGMAFFSVSLMLHVSGVKAADFRHLDLRPSAIAKAFYETQGKLVKYYENIRVVVEIESRVQQLKRATTSDETPAPPKPNDRKQQKSDPENQKQIRNHTPENDPAALARIFGWPTLAGVARVGGGIAPRRMS
jgi:hypothetical protein